VLKKKIWANFQRIIELYTQKIVTKFSKIWVWDPGSGIRKKPIPDPEVKKAPDPGSVSATLNKEHPALQNMKILYFFYICTVCHFALLDPDPDPATQINADPCGSGSTTLLI
jgi:hypothetical protein